MHPSVMEFVREVLVPERVRGSRVIEIGSYNVNGSVREIIEPMKPAIYLGTDMRPGPGVDHVSPAEKLCWGEDAHFARGEWDYVVCTEMLEHAKHWQLALISMLRLLREGGYFLVTTRSIGFPLHDFPGDYWRFSVNAMHRILSAAEMKILVCRPDHGIDSPGVFAFARRPYFLDSVPPAWDSEFGVTPMGR